MTGHPKCEAIEYSLEIGRSGRWNRLRDTIYSLPYEEPNEQKWLFTVFLGLYTSLCREYLELKKSYEDPSSSLGLLAWRARNLLEIMIWIIYCTKSESNARTLYEDVGRDGLDLLKAFSKFGYDTNQPEEWQAMFHPAAQKLIDNAKLHQIEDLDANFSRIHNVASQIVMSTEFAVSNKNLSKFAHPTAFSILGFHKPKEIMFLKTSFYEQGCNCFSNGFVTLENYANLNLK